MRSFFFNLTSCLQNLRNMIKFLFFFSSLLFFLPSYAQTFAPIGATWHYTIADNAPNKDSLRWIQRKVVADTLFAGRSAKLFNFSFESVNALPCPDEVDTALMSASNDSLFFYEDSHWQLLVNFNDTVGAKYDYLISIPNSNGTQFARCTISVQVDSVKTVSLNNQSLKSLYLKEIGSNGTFDFFEGWITEIIGHEKAMIPWVRSSCAFTGRFLDGLRCYSDTLLGNISFIAPIACTAVVVGLEEQHQDKAFLNIGPNPSDGQVQIETNLSIDYISIYSLGGQLLKRISSVNNGNIFSLPSEKAIYLIQIRSREGETFTQKILRK